jgi:molybdopterin-binding protein
MPKSLSKTSSTSIDKPATARSERRSLSRGWRAVLVLVGLVALYTALGFGGVPLAIEKVVLPRVNERLNGSANLKMSRFNPYTFFIDLRGVEVRDDSGQPAAALDRVVVNFDPTDSLFQGGWRFSEVTVTNPVLRARLSAEKSLNFVRLYKPAAPSPNAPPSKPIEKLPRLLVEKLSVEGGTASFRDESLPEPFEKEWGGVAFQIDKLDTRPDNKNALRLVASTADGASVEWTGAFYVNPITASGTLVLKDLQLPVLMPYVKTMSEGVVTSGRLSAEVTYEFAPAAAPRVVTATITKATVAELKVSQGDAEVVSSPLFEVEGAKLDASTGRSVNVARLRSDGAKLLLHREKDGNLSQIRLFPAAAQEAATAPTEVPAAPAAPGESAAVPRVDPASIAYPVEQLVTAMQQVADDVLGAWDISLEKIEVTGAGATYTDVSTARPVEVVAHDVSLTAGPIRSAEKFATPFTSAGRLGERGSYEVSGNLAPFERLAELKVKAAGVDISKASPYIPEQAIGPLPASRLVEGHITLDGALTSSLSMEQVFEATWDGMLTAEGVRIDDVAAGTAMVTLDKVDVHGKTSASVLDQRLKTFAWDGELSLAGAKVDAPLAGPVKAGVESLKFTGQADQALNVKGSMDCGGARLEMPEMMELSVALARAAVTEAVFDPAARLLTAAEVVVEGPDAKAALALLPPPAEKGTKPAKSADKEKGEGEPEGGPVRRLVPELPVNARIAALRVSGGRVEVRELSSTPPALLTADEISFEGQNIATDGSAEAQVKAEARLGENGRARLSGKANVFADSPTADVQLAVASVHAEPYEPYVGRFIGYAVDSGRVGATIPLTLKENKIKGKLDFTLDQFFLGDSMDSPEALDVPVKLGLDLLRDMDKNVKASVPLSGDLSDPQFSIGGLIGKAIVNIIVGAATAPFQLLGGLFGALEGQDISFVSFDPGTTEIAADELSKIDVLARAMSERPAFKMKVAGRVSEKEDVPAIKLAILREQMLERRKRENRQAAMLTDEEYLTKVQDAYKEMLSKSGERVAARKDLPGLAVMEKALVAEIEIPPERLAELGKARADRVVRILAEDSKIAIDRVSVVEAAEAGENKGDKPVATFEVH